MNQKLKQLKITVILTVLGGIFGSLLQLFLFLRATPYGKPYVIDNSHYLYHALFYNWYGMALIALPFIIWTLFFGDRGARFRNSLHTLTVLTSLIVSQMDNELLRFMGHHISFDWIATYGTLSGIPHAIWAAIIEDAGGSWSSVILFLVPFLFLASIPLAGRINFTPKLNRHFFRFLILASVTVLYVLPFLFRTSLFGGKNRQAKVKPPVILVRDNVLELFETNSDFSSIDDQVEKVQTWWKEGNSEDGWKFTGGKNPLEKVFEGECKNYGEKPWNFIVIVLETFRARDMALFNPDVKFVATPYLNSLAKSEKSAYWNRFISNGQPTIHSFMAVHSGLPPHSRKTVAKAFTRDNIESYALILRRNGYHTAFFGGSDPDWDNQRFWLNKWYDSVYFDPKNDEQDRLVFEEMSRHLKAKGKDGKPFVATLFSISNHVPFDNPEPKHNLYNGSELRSKIYNTMHYNDLVIKDFMDSIKDEPWFKNTVFIFTGDHAYDLGDRGSSLGHTNIRHETNWVPFIMHSNHPLQLHGLIEGQASHMDLAPTILEMAGLCEKNSFLGHSLFKRTKEVYSFNIKSGNMAIENSHFSSFFPKLGDPYLYSESDHLQEENIAKDHKDVLEKLKEKATATSVIIDYIYEKNLLP